MVGSTAISRVGGQTLYRRSRPLRRSRLGTGYRSSSASRIKSARVTNIGRNREGKTYSAIFVIVATRTATTTTTTKSAGRDRYNGIVLI